LIRPRDEKLAGCPVEQEVGIAARQEARGRLWRFRGAQGRLVVRKQPLVAEWRSDGQKRIFQRGERIGTSPPRDPGPMCEPVSGSRPEDVEVAPSELAARLGRIDLGGATVQTIGARAPSQRIATVPVVAAYLSPLPTPSARPISRSVARASARWAWIRSAIRSARRRPLAVSASLPSENSAKSCSATT
jgi:hypothetical protein